MHLFAGTTSILLRRVSFTFPSKHPDSDKKPTPRARYICDVLRLDGSNSYTGQCFTLFLSLCGLFLCVGTFVNGDIANCVGSQLSCDTPYFLPTRLGRDDCSSRRMHRRPNATRYGCLLVEVGRQELGSARLSASVSLSRSTSRSTSRGYASVSMRSGNLRGAKMGPRLGRCRRAVR